MTQKSGSSNYYWAVELTSTAASVGGIERGQPSADLGPRAENPYAPTGERGALTSSGLTFMHSLCTMLADPANQTVRSD